jgi:hypothetical protein
MTKPTKKENCVSECVVMSLGSGGDGHDGRAGRGLRFNMPPQTEGGIDGLIEVDNADLLAAPKELAGVGWFG